MINSRKKRNLDLSGYSLRPLRLGSMYDSKDGSRIKGEIGQQLCARYQAMRCDSKEKDCLIRILIKATRMLLF